jgi:O-antigen/teichoic acid export membrane protein
MGKYSNYALVAGSVITLIDIVIGSVSASVGNLSASTDTKKNISVLRRLFYINFALLTLFSCVLLNTLNPFIKLWIGEKYLFDMATVAVIIASFYFSCIRDPVQVFLNAYGIFEKSGYMTLCRAFVNFVLSVLFVKKYGIAGVFLGTAISAATVPLWCEPVFLYKYGFKSSVRPFMLEMFSLIGVSVLACAVSFLLCRSIPGNLFGIAARGTLSAGVAIVFSVLVLLKGKERY